MATSYSLDYLGTVRARVGYLLTPSLLAYGSGGLAYGQANLSTQTSLFAATPSGALAGFAGWFGELLEPARRLDRRGRHGVDVPSELEREGGISLLRSRGCSTSGPVAGTSPSGAPFAAFTLASQASARFNGHIVRGGVNYHFDFGASVSRSSPNIERVSGGLKPHLAATSETSNPMGAIIASFEDMIAPTSLAEFFSKYWEKQPLFMRRSSPHYYEALLTLENVQNAISAGGLRYPAIQLSKGGGFLPPEAYCQDIRSGDVRFSGVPNIGRLHAEYQSGATISLPGFHRAWEPLQRTHNRRRSVSGPCHSHECLPHAGRGLRLWSAL